MLAVAEHKRIHSDLIPRIASGFCGGLAHSDGTCGAVSGGVMAISLYLGRDKSTDPKDKLYQTVREFLGKFRTEFGEVNCYSLTGVHLRTPEGQRLFEEKGQIKKCTEYVGGAVRMVLELVEEK